MKDTTLTTKHLRLEKIQRNIGFCQLNYFLFLDNRKFHYCLQDNGEKFGGIRLMRCTQDYEPNYEAKIPCATFEKPIVDHEFDSEYTIKLKNLCLDWINKNN